MLRPKAAVGRETLGRSGLLCRGVGENSRRTLPKAVESVDIPIIGIGAGPADGQVLVVDDMLGKNNGFSPKFLRRYADLHTIMTDAIGAYVADVKTGDFPNANESY